MHGYFHHVFLLYFHLISSSNIRALTHIDVHEHAYLFLMLSEIMHVSSCLQTCDNDVTKQLLRFSLLTLC